MVWPATVRRAGAPSQRASRCSPRAKTLSTDELVSEVAKTSAKAKAAAVPDRVEASRDAAGAASKVAVEKAAKGAAKAPARAKATKTGTSAGVTTGKAADVTRAKAQRPAEEVGDCEEKFASFFMKCATGTSIRMILASMH